MKRSKLLVFLFLFCLVNFLAKADITVNINGLTTVPQIQSAIQTGITSLSSSGGGIVTVINEDSGGNSVPYTNANGALTLNIPFDVSVFWNLNYSSSGAFIGPMLTLSGSGAFELINGSSLIHNFNGTGTAGGTTLRITGAGTSLTIRDGSNLFSDLGGYGILIAASNVTINVNSNGIIKSSTGNSNAAIHINNDFQGIVINVDGGSIISEDSGYAIEDGTGTATIPNNALINVGNETNSLVQSGSTSAIRGRGAGTIVMISGGTITSANPDNFNPTINMSGSTIENVIITGGSVQATALGGYCVQTTGNVSVSGGTVTAINGRAINLVGMNSIAAISGGKIETTGTGHAVCTATTNPETVVNASVIVTGGLISSTSGDAIHVTGANSAVTIEGGIVQATTGYGIYGQNIYTPIDIYGGFVFAFGTDITGTPASNNVTNRPPHVTDGVLVAWNNPNSTPPPEYIVFSTDALIRNPAGATVVWYDDGTGGGIAYVNGNNSGFFNLDVIVQSLQPDIDGVLYVDLTKTGNGSSWEDAYPNLSRPLLYAAQQRSILLGSPTNLIKQIFIAEGTYKPLFETNGYHFDDKTFPEYDGGRNNAFILVPNLKIFGGFIPQNLTPPFSLNNLPSFGESGRNGVTTLSGDTNGDDIDGDFTQYRDDNTYHVVIGVGIDQDTETSIDGVTISGGHANLGNLISVNGVNNIDLDYGGGIYNRNSSPLLNNLIISDNYAMVRGGGVYNIDSSPSLANVDISKNTVGQQGGGIFNFNSNPSLFNVNISENESGNTGGGMVNRDGSSPTLVNVTVIGNNGAASGGGIRNYTNSSPILTNVLISGNKSTSSGGGIFNYDNSSPVMTNVTISGNYSGNQGGGISNEVNSFPVISNSVIWGNVASNAATNNVENVSGSNSSFTHSLIEGSIISGVWQTAFGNDLGNNIATNPMFLNLITPTSSNTPNILGDHRLNDLSPAIDAGNFILNATSTDLDGNPRVMGDNIDMGAYENEHAAIISPKPTDNILYIDHTKSGDGSSWEDAFPNLSLAMIYAAMQQADVSGTNEEEKIIEIRIAEGTHYPKFNADGYNFDNKIFPVTDGGRDNAFVLVPRVKTYGGFKPLDLDPPNSLNALPDYGETGRDGITIFSGDINGDDIEGDLSINKSDNVYHVVIAVGTVADNIIDQNTLLDGITITGGNADNIPWNITINGKTVNGGDSGGNYNDSASPMFNYVTINENIGTRRGGGMFNINSSPILNNVIISGNNANPGWGSGAGIYNDGSNPTLTNVIISDNKAIGDGGGIYNINMSSPFLKNVIINGNSCEFMGGGIFSENSQSVLINVTISGNVASSTTFGVGGGMYVSYYSYPILTNVTISGNLAADMGGGIFNDVSSEPQISNSIIWGNSAPSFINVHNRINSNPVFSNSLIEGSIIGGVWQTALFGTDGGFNIDDDPHFVQWIDPQSVTMPTTDGDYRLQVTSPAIEKGNNQAYLDALIIDNFDNETDLSGNPRLRGHFIDMGAYEYPLEEITNVAIIVTAPVVNVAPNNSASPDGLADYTIEDVFWMPGHNPFQGEQPYTVTVTIEANVGFIFMDLATATINGQPAQVTYNPDGTITISFTFEPLDKLDPDVIFPDGATMFYGQQLSQATLNGGTITTEGTFAFATPAAMPTVAQSGYFQLIFTPDDTNIYNIITDDIYVTVLPLTISISDVSHTKIYDGNSTALNVIVTLDDNDILIGDIGDVDVDLVTAEYILSTAGTTTLTITAIDLTGSKAENYTILLPETFEVDGIIQKTIGIVDVSHTKIYDGNTTGLNVIVTLDDNDILIGDIGDVEVDLVTAEYILSTAGTTTLTITAIDLTGSKAENYTILLPETFEVDGIMQRPIEITGFSITKIYDGTTDVLDFGNLEFVNLVDNENADVDISGVTANYASSEVGVHLITFVGEFGMLPIGLTNPNNYIITQPTGINGIITPDSPVIITDNLPDGIVGVPYNETLLASGYQPITWNIENGNLPDNLYLDSDTGIISGTPTLAGTYNFKVKATNDAGFDEKDFTIVIHNAPEHPMIITDELPDGMVGVPYNEIVEAVGDQPITWNIENGNLPNDLYLDSYTGIISGTPTLAGTFTFTIKATNDAGFDEKDFTIVIHNAPEHPMIITDELPDGMVGVPYNKIVEAVGDQPITWNIENGNLPESLNLDSDTGIISGTPTLAGTYTFKIKATNDAGFDEKDFTIVIHDAPEHPIIITDELPDGMVGVPYNEIVEAVGDQPITWNIENGNLPNDLNLDSETGIISGIPTLAGTYTFTIKATNDAGFDEKDFIIVIHNAPQHPHIYTETLPDGMVGVPYNEIVEAVGDQPITWNIEDGNLPNNLYLDSDTGIISGTPTLAGTYTFTIKATNDAGFDERDFTIVIHNAPEHPHIYTETLPDGMVGVPYNEIVEAVGDQPITWNIEDGNLPNDLNLDSDTGIISGTPSLAGTYNFKIKATNNAGFDEKDFTIVIHDAPEHPMIITDELPDGMVGVPYNEIVEAVGDQPITWNIENGNLPNDLYLDSDTGIISGTPTLAGTYNFKVKATNDSGFDEKDFTIVIHDAPEHPMIITETLPDGIVGVPYNEIVEAVGDQPITWNIENGNLPNDLYLDSETGIISGIPTLAGTYNFKVKATNDAGFDERDFTIVIHDAPEHPHIYTETLPDGMVGVPYNEIVEAVGDQPITWNIEDGNLPNDLNLDSDTGIISGTPTLAGTFTFTIKATNDAGFDEKDFTIVIHNAPQHPHIYTETLPDGMVGVPYNEIVEAVGDQPITWNIEDGNLPNDLYLDSETGIISGTPTLAGTYNFKVKATNDAGFDEKDFTIVIHDAPEHPIIITEELPDGMVGVPYNEVIEAVGNTPMEWFMIDGIFPNGLSADLSSTDNFVIITGTPTLATTFTFTIRAINEAGRDEKEFTIIIHEAPEHPIIITEVLPDGMVGVPYNEIVEAIGDQPITWNLESGDLPNGLNFDVETAIISGMPSQIGTFTFTIKATNDAGFDEKEFTIIILDTPDHPIIITEVLPFGMVGMPYSAIIEAVGIKPITWEIEIDNGNLPDGLNLDIETGIISGIPTLEGVFTFTIKAENDAGFDKKEFTIFINNILVDDVVAEYGGDGRFYAMAFISCDDSSVKVEIETEDTSVVIEIDGIKENPHNVNLNNLNYGENEISVKINEQEYIVVIDKPVPFFDIVVLRWDNRLTVINNPENNHGYKFTSFQWYQNGQPAGTEQSWSADSNGNPINTNDIFYVEVEGHLLSNPDNIIKLRTCETHITWLHDHNLIVYPIPVSSGQTLWLETDIDDIEFYETAEIEVYDLLGIVIDKFRLQGRITTINISYNSGVYMFVLRNKDGFTKELKVTVK